MPWISSLENTLLDIYVLFSLSYQKWFHLNTLSIEFRENSKQWADKSARTALYLKYLHQPTSSRLTQLPTQKLLADWLQAAAYNCERVGRPRTPHPSSSPTLDRETYTYQISVYRCNRALKAGILRHRPREYKIVFSVQNPLLEGEPLPLSMQKPVTLWPLCVSANNYLI